MILGLGLDLTSRRISRSLGFSFFTSRDHDHLCLACFLEMLGLLKGRAGGNSNLRFGKGVFPGHPSPPDPKPTAL